MKRCQLLIGVILFTLILCSTAISKGLDSARQPVPDKIAALPMMPASLQHVAVHDAGNLYTTFFDGFFSIGFYGEQQIFDPETSMLLNHTNYPSGSDLYYLYYGGIWIGGVVNGDTVVSTLSDGWYYHWEMHPHEWNSGGTYRTGGVADDEFVTVITDTNRTYNPRPMDLDIRMETFSFEDTLYDDFVIINFKVSTFGFNTIDDGWAGIYFDSDVNHSSNSTSGYLDDYSGYLEALSDESDSTSLMKIAYSLDNDGDPRGIPQEFTPTSPRGAISLQLLDANFDLEHVNFNWWRSSEDTPLDFGPRRTGTPEDPFYQFDNNALGTPGELHDAMYYLLAHPEVDYDQLYTAIDHSAEGWLQPPASTISNDLTDGCDTRFLLSFGPFDLIPGDTVTFTVALVAADNIHVNGSDFADYFDADNPDAFYSLLDFSELILHNKRARELYLSGYTLMPLRPPVGFEIVDFDEDTVNLTWYSVNRANLAGYNVYFRDTDGDTIWYKANSSLITETSTSASVIDSTHVHEFAVTTVLDDASESDYSEIVSVATDWPDAPSGLVISSQGNELVLDWDDHPDSNISYFVVYRSAYGGEFERFGYPAQSTRTDATAEYGVRIYYYVTAMNIFGNESPPSEIVGRAPMSKDQGILFIDASRTFDIDGSYYFDTTSYGNLFNGINSMTQITRRVVYTSPPSNPVSFYEMSQYSHLVIFMESRFSDITTPSGMLHLDSLAYYLAYGGNAVITTVSGDFTGLTTGPAESPETVSFNPGDFFYDVFKLDSTVRNVGIVRPDETVVGDLVGCSPLHSDYLPLVADTAQLHASGLFPTFIPGSGFLFPQPEAEAIYSYESSVPDTVNQGKVNGIRYLGEDYRFVLFNFPLTVMKELRNQEMLLQALSDIGIDIYCGDTNDDGFTNIGDAVYLVQHIFGGGPPPANYDRADVNCDKDVNIGDAVSIINYVFREDATLRCCIQ